MTRSLLRFAHASNLRLDLPLRGVGRLSDSARRLAMDAPACAWERVVEACVDRDVEFLLLTPQTRARFWSPIDRRNLWRGFRQLEEFGIRVYWASAADEAPADDQCDSWPDNVTRLTSSGNPATLIREGRAVAALCMGPTSIADLAASETVSSAAPGLRPLRIAIPADAGMVDRVPLHGEDVVSFADADYVACWGSLRSHSRKTASTVWLDPGSPQGRTADEAGGSGISIVEWNGERISDVVRAPTSPIRWERCVLGVAPETTHEEFAERMQLALLEREPTVEEQLWFVDWHIVGSGPVFDSLQAETTRSQLEELADAAAGGHDGLLRVHRWDLRTRGGAASGGVGLQLQEWLAEQGEFAWSQVSRDLESELRRSDLAAAADRLPLVVPAAVRDEAQRQLGTWLIGAAQDAV